MTLTELEQLAKAATPGPWKMDKGGRLKCLSRDAPQIFGLFRGIASTDQHVKEHVANNDFIAAANPQIILELIKRHLELAEFVKGCRFAGDLKSSWISAGAHELLDQFGPDVPLGEKK